MQRTDLLGTSPEAHREMLRRLRALTPEQRLAMVIVRVDAGRAMNALAMKRLQEERVARRDFDR